MIDQELLKSAVENLKTVDPGVYNEVWEQDVYKVQMTDVMGRLVVDVGSHIGLFGAKALSLGAHTVWMFEPNPESAKACRESGLTQIMQCDLFEQAVGDSQSEVVLTGHGSRTTSHPVIPTDETYAGLTKVHCEPFESILKSVPTGSVLKLDVEGAEYGILYSVSANDLRKFQIIWIEVHTTPEHPNGINAMADYLQTIGYQMKWSFPLMEWLTKDGQIINMKPVSPAVTGFRFDLDPRFASSPEPSSNT